MDWYTVTVTKKENRGAGGGGGGGADQVQGLEFEKTLKYADKNKFTMEK
jgi:hypothetical protein